MRDGCGRRPAGPPVPSGARDGHVRDGGAGRRLHSRGRRAPGAEGVRAEQVLPERRMHMMGECVRGQDGRR